jgi:hypothetical protein
MTVLKKHSFFLINFKKEYAEWRTDYSIALQCHCCDAMFTVKHVGKASLFLAAKDAAALS